MSTAVIETSSTSNPWLRTAHSGGTSGAGTRRQSLFPDVLTSFRARLTSLRVLNHVENAVRLAQPLVLGLAVNELLQQRYTGLGGFVALHLFYLLVSTSRQMFATRVFSAIRVERAEREAITDRDTPATSAGPARRSAERETAVTFQEFGAPQLVRASYNIVGSLAVLTWYDWRLTPLCLLLVLPAVLLHAAYGRRVSLLSGRLLASGDRRDAMVSEADSPHHRLAAGDWQVKLSDADALNFCLTQLFVLGLTAAALIQFCSQLNPAPGDILAVLSYLLLFVLGLDAAPRLITGWMTFGRRTSVGD